MHFISFAKCRLTFARLKSCTGRLNGDLSASCRKQEVGNCLNILNGASEIGSRDIFISYCKFVGLNVF